MKRGMILLIVFPFIAFYFIPVLGIIFCLNLVSIIKKVKTEEPTAANTFWLTASFVLIVWTIALGAFFNY